MASNLAKRDCEPCRGGAEPLRGEALARLARELDGGWRTVDEHHIEKEYKLAGWREAVNFTNRIARIADEQDHHPDIHLSYGKVRIEIWSHKIDGLTENDFVLAAKADEAFDG